MTKKLSRLFIFLVLIIILIEIIACNGFYESSYEVLINKDDRVYTIDPFTILGELKRGNSEVFNLMKATPEGKPNRPAMTIFWNQADYFKVVKVLQQKGWQDPIEGLVLSSMIFNLSCSDIEQGAFSDGRITYSKVIQLKGESRRIEYNYIIIPSNERIYSTKYEYGPNVYNPNQIDMSRYRFTAEAVLQIAEKNGGAEKRLEFGNACEISLHSSGQNGKNWEVSYRTDNKYPDTFFIIIIDPETGAFNVMESKTKK